jgi:diaminopimelate epimerase
MRRLSYVKCSPGGNITTLVFTGVERPQQPDIAKQIMVLQPSVEQVGFVEEPRHPRAVARLQMMGGEFCGNAARSLAWVLFQKRWPGTFEDDGIISLEVSGVQRLLQVEIRGEMVKVEMPIRKEFSSVRSVGQLTVVDLEGISHAIIHRAVPGDAKVEADRILSDLNLKELEAAGVLFCERWDDAISMTPFVWVRDMGMLKEETACGSGTACIALAEAAITGESVIGLQVRQPSGSIITTSVELDDGCFKRAFIEGPVEVLEEGEIGVKLSR